MRNNVLISLKQVVVPQQQSATVATALFRTPSSTSMVGVGMSLCSSQFHSHAATLQHAAGIIIGAFCLLLALAMVCLVAQNLHLHMH